MVTSEIRKQFHTRSVKILVISRAFKTREKLFPNFTSIPFDYLLISWVTNYAQNRGWFRLVYICRQKTARVLYPTAQDEPSQGLKDIFITPVLKNPHPLGFLQRLLMP